jgi:hypothetical protein
MSDVIMKKELLVIFLGVFLILSISFASAGGFEDFWNKITGKVISQDELIAHYSFENNVNDVSGNGNNGVNNGASFVEGKIGKAGSFDGVNDYVNLKSDLLDEAGEFSVGMWVRIDSINYYSTLFNKLYSFFIVITPDRKIMTWKGTGNKWEGSSRLVSNGQLSSGGWHYVVFSSDSENSYIYIDGKLDKKGNSMGVIPSSSKIEVGYRKTEGTQPYDGRIDELKIWNRVLSSSEVLNEYQSCTESWTCTGWSTCANSQQTRACTDNNDCETTNNKPSETQTCTPETCTESWTCTGWSTCANSQQTRACTDNNDCETTNNKPSETQSCEDECIPDCSGSQCGGDGCEGICGTCEMGSQCIENQCISSCVDNDNDGYSIQIVSGADCGFLDCNDNNNLINPGQEEICSNNIDDNCDGSIDENCACSTGETKLCGTTDLGECEKGTQTCISSKWGTCSGNIEPIEEICDNKDNDCDGSNDENLIKSCGTTDIGECRLGVELCSAGNWIGCNSVDPISEICKNSKDDDCDDETDEEDCTLDCRGCIYDQSCLDTGFRLTIDNYANYCDNDQNVKVQKEIRNDCNNNYECLSNECSGGVCVGLIEEIREQASLLKKIWCKITNLVDDEGYMECINEESSVPEEK